MKSDVRCLISWPDLAQKEFAEFPWLIEPYIPVDGIVFFWGETSTGKSPLGWAMAAAIGRGDNFFGLPARKGKVLYLEVDTPQRLVHKRVQALQPVEGVDFLFLPPLSVPNVDGPDMALLERAAARGYDLVVVNTLRKVHDLNDKEPQTPKVVYSWFQKLFPGTALVFVHHTKKTQIDANGNASRTKENFSGAMNWLNDAQVGIHLQSYENKQDGTNIRLRHLKSQVSDLYGPLSLALSKQDGATITCPKFDQLYATYMLMHEMPDLRGRFLDETLEKKFGWSRSTAMRRRTTIEDGLFPGTGWLGREAQPSEGESTE